MFPSKHLICIPANTLILVHKMLSVSTYINCVSITLAQCWLYICEGDYIVMFAQSACQLYNLLHSIQMYMIIQVILYLELLPGCVYVHFDVVMSSQTYNMSKHFNGMSFFSFAKMTQIIV